MQTAPLRTLRFHQLVADLPGLIPRDSREFAALADDVAARGIDQPLIVVLSDGEPRIIDGRNRFHAATVANLDEVPIVIREESEAMSIILGTLVQRRHYGKGALAYLAYPLAAAQKRTGAGRPAKLSIQSTITIDEIAAQLGFARDLFYQAAKVHEFFLNRPDLRAQFEPRILAGEVGLGACVAGMASSVATTDSSRKDRSPYQLITDTFGALRKRFEQRWERLEGSARLAVTEEATATFLSLPKEVQQSIVNALKSGKAGL